MGVRRISGKPRLILTSFVLVLFVTAKTGMTYKKYREECNTGDGPKVPTWMFYYMRFVLPILIGSIMAVGYYNIFLR